MGQDEKDSGRPDTAAEGDRTRLAKTSPAEAAGLGGEQTYVPLGTVLSFTYRVEELLGRGGMGEVYRATHLELQTQHAIKIIRPEFANAPKIVELFRREAATLRTLRNDAIVAYDGIFRDEAGRLYLVMEYVGGPSLSQVLKERRLSPDDVRRLRDRLGLGLAAAHEKGVVHRDISPENVILPDGEIVKAKIIDFGIAKLADPLVATIVGDDFAGKYLFASPEQLGMFGGRVDARSDIYSLGLVLCAAAIGEPLDMGKSPSAVIERRREIPDLSRVPVELRAEMARMLEPDPDRRPGSMWKMLSRESEGTSGATIAKPGARFVRSGAIAAIVLILFALGGGAFLLLNSRQESRQATEKPSTVPAAPQTGQGEKAPPASSAPTTPQAGQAQKAPPAGPEPPHPSGPEVEQPTNQAALPAIDLAQTQAQLNRVASSFACADLRVSFAQDGLVSAAGFVSTEQDKAGLVRAMTIPGVTRVDDAKVSLLKWPFCEAVLTLTTQAQTGGAEIGAPTIELNNATHVYRDGDKLVIKAKATSRFDGYLYLAFLDGNGAVTHLLQSATMTGRHMTASQEVRLGTHGELAMAPPYGENLIVAISSKQPLYSTRQNQEERAADYFAALKAGLRAVSAGEDSDRPLASYVYLTVNPAY